jgi:hypothetical protein
MKLFPASYFSLNEPECNPIHTIACNSVVIDSLDAESVVYEVPYDEALSALNIPKPILDEPPFKHPDEKYYYVTNRLDGYGYLVNILTRFQYDCKVC